MSGIFESQISLIEDAQEGVNGFIEVSKKTPGFLDYDCLHYLDAFLQQLQKGRVNPKRGRFLETHVSSELQTIKRLWWCWNYWTDLTKFEIELNGDLKRVADGLRKPNKVSSSRTCKRRWERFPLHQS